MSRDGLFVYGTLLPDEANGGLVKHLNPYLQKFAVIYIKCQPDTPALHLDGTDWVHGQYLFEPESRLLQILDVYEGVHEVYIPAFTSMSLWVLYDTKHGRMS